MLTNAIVLSAPGQLAVDELALTPPLPGDVVIDMAWSGISTGTERLLYEGRMPPFPGMGYPLVPGYEGVGRVAKAGADAGTPEGTLVFVPGANCYGAVRGLFGGTASRVVTAATRVVAGRSRSANGRHCWRWRPRHSMRLRCRVRGCRI